MNIAYVSNVVYPFVKGGAEKRISEIGHRLARGRHEVTIYSRHHWDGPKVMQHEGMTLRAAAPPADLYNSGERRSIKEAIDFATRIAIVLGRRIDEHDLVVASVFPYFPVLSANLLTMAKRIPLVTTWHEVWLDYWDGYLGRLAPFGQAVEQLTARVPQHPIAVSSVTADRLATIGPERDQIAVVPNGINLDQVRSIPPAEDGFDALFVGRLIEDKHVDRLIRAFSRITDDATLGIVGDGPERQRLETLANNTNAVDRITFLGFLRNYEDVLAHMKASTVFASPSTREGFGITYLEAMAADCVVIGADHPQSAAKDVIGDAGFVVLPTEEAIADALERALNGHRPPVDPSSVVHQYDWDVIAEHAAREYRRAVDRH